MKLLINASAICMDYYKLAEQTAVINRRADMLHFDLMDGHFIPRLGLHPDFAAALAGRINVPIDIHLLCTCPMDYAETMAKAVKSLSAKGISSYFVPHAEALGGNIEKDLEKIKENGFRPGLALSHDTDVKNVLPYLSSIDKLTFLTRDPKSSNPGFVPSVLENIRMVNEYKKENAPNLLIETDGPCDDDILPLLLDAGVESMVVGNSFLFRNDPDLVRAWDIMEIRIDKAKRIVENSRR